MMRPKVVLLIFVSGKIVLTGAKVREEIYMAFNQIYSVLVGESFWLILFVVRVRVSGCDVCRVVVDMSGEPCAGEVVGWICDLRAEEDGQGNWR